MILFIKTSNSFLVNFLFFLLKLNQIRPLGVFFRIKEKHPEALYFKDFQGVLVGDPAENRTRVTAVKGRCLDRLTTGHVGPGLHQLFSQRIEGLGARS